MPFFGVPIRNGLPIGLGSVAGFGAPQEFSPSELFVGGTAGAWYDPSDLSTMFDTSAGTTPVAMPGLGAPVPVGLMLDKSQGLVLGSELVTNGGPGFTATTGWAASGATVNASGGKLVCAVTSAGPSVYWTLTTVIGTWYQVNIVWENVNATNPSILVNSTGGLSITTTNTNATVYFCAVATSTFVQMLLGSGGPTTNTRIISLSAKTIAGNHAIAANDSTKRPVLMARVNLLTYSEEFSNAAWAPTGVTVSTNTVVAPDGATTADTITGDGAVSTHWLTQSNAALASGKTWSICAKAGTNNFIQLIFAGDADPWANFDLSGGVVGSTGTNVAATISALGNGWYRCTISTPSSLASSVFVALVNSASAPRNQSVALSTSVHLWGADLRPANIGANVPAYQRIADANTYDTSGFPLYLRFDGIDDSMYTPANLNLSGTDKVAVFAGVRKLGTTPNMVTEFSPNISNNGTFYILGNNLSANDYGFALRGTAQVTYLPTPYVAPISNVLAVSCDIAGAAIADEIVPRINGVIKQNNPAGSNAGTGNFGTYPLYIGSRNNAELRFNGHLYSLIIAGSAVSAGNINATEQWVAGKTGIVIP